MDFDVWIDAEDNIYITSKNRGLGITTASGDQILEAMNVLLVDQEEYQNMTYRSLLEDGESLWVDPEVLNGDHDVWDNESWMKDMDDEEGVERGWVPVIRVPLRAATTGIEE